MGEDCLEERRKAYCEGLSIREFDLRERLNYKAQRRFRKNIEKVQSVSEFKA